MPNARSPQKRSFSVSLPRSLIAQLDEIKTVEERSRNQIIELFLRAQCEAWFAARTKPWAKSETEIKSIYHRLTKGKGTWPPDEQALQILHALPFNDYPLEEGVMPDYSEEELAHQRALVSKLVSNAEARPVPASAHSPDNAQ